MTPYWNMADDAKKCCAHCGTELTRKRNESPVDFRARRTCNFQCMGRWYAATRSRPAHERFWPNVRKCDDADACWEWLGRRDQKGYGRFGRGHLAHRFAFAFVNGPIPEGLEVCHRCDNPVCVRPSHLFLGTHTDNVRDSIAKGRAAFCRKTHCVNGHEMTLENSVPRHGRERGRRCRICMSASQRIRDMRRRQKARATV